MNRDNSQANTFFEKGWVVGIFEGEGWVVLNKQLLPSKNYRYVPVIGMNNTSQEVIDRYIEILKKNNIGVWVGKRRFLETNNKDQWVTNVNGFQRCKKWIDLFLEDIHHKKSQLELLKKYIQFREKLNNSNACGETEEQIYLEIKKLNQKGKASTT
jgi:hypothetical protein